MFGHDHITLQSLLSVSDEQSVLWRTFLQELNAQGGDIGDLDRLLKDSKNGRSLLIKFARMVMGRIWELTDEHIDLGTIDYGKEFEDAQWKHCAPPKTPCKYSLFRPDLTKGSIWSATLPVTMEHAGYHELEHYVRHVEAEMPCFSIAAAGCTLEAGKDGPYIPHVTKGIVRGDDYSYGVHYSLGGPQLTRMSFYLVRVYES